ncbi:hypothetical protein CRN61_24425 [Vibrio vulnificus]|nr:hypothetical protein CRN61_24425 [Vibrio vulnificus]
MASLVDGRIVAELRKRPAEAIDWGTRLELERSLDLYLWIEESRPEFSGFSANSAGAYPMNQS